MQISTLFSSSSLPGENGQVFCNVTVNRYGGGGGGGEESAWLLARKKDRAEKKKGIVLVNRGRGTDTKQLKVSTQNVFVKI